ncbi:MAG TPA: hypothetical protein VIF62_37450 [Labilithrix sp.]
MRALALALVLAFVAACAHPASVVVEDANPSRTPDGHVQVDVLVTGAEQGGGFVGHYCVSVHWLGPIDANTAKPAPTYYGELDSVTQCFDGLGDGDRRAVRFLSNHVGGDLTPGTTLRAQAEVASAIETLDVDNP